MYHNFWQKLSKKPLRRTPPPSQRVPIMYTALIKQCACYWLIGLFASICSLTHFKMLFLFRFSQRRQRKKEISTELMCKKMQNGDLTVDLTSKKYMKKCQMAPFCLTSHSNSIYNNFLCENKLIWSAFARIMRVTI